MRKKGIKVGSILAGASLWLCMVSPVSAHDTGILEIMENPSPMMVETSDSFGNRYNRYIFDQSFVNHPFQVGNFTILEKPKEQVKDYWGDKYDDGRTTESIYSPNPEMIKEVVEYLLNELKKEGIIVQGFMPGGATITTTNMTSKEALGEAFQSERRINVFSQKESYNKWTPSQTYDVVIHEIGHVVETAYFGNYMQREGDKTVSGNYFDEYRKIREIPDKWGNYDDAWGKRPREIFAEDFKEIFMPSQLFHQNKSDLGNFSLQKRKELRDFYIQVLKQSCDFSDITRFHFAYPAIKELYMKNVFANDQELMEKGKFQPQEPITKENFYRWLLEASKLKWDSEDYEIIKKYLVLYKKEQSKELLTKKEVINLWNDILGLREKNEFYGLTLTEEIKAWYREGVRDQQIASVFEDNQNITRGEAALVLYAYLQQPVGEETNPFEQLVEVYEKKKQVETYRNEEKYREAIELQKEIIQEMGQNAEEELILGQLYQKAALTHLKIYLNGEEQSFVDAQPFLQNNRTLVPLRFMAEKTGVEVAWNGESRTVHVKGKNQDVMIPIGGKKALVNGKEVELDVPSFVKEQRTFVPLRFLGETLGMDIYWEKEGNIIFISQK